MTYKLATVFGGTGFLGRQIVRELAQQGYRIRVATRVPEKAFFLRPCGDVGQVVPFHCDYSAEDSIAVAVRGADIVVNTVGILFEKKKGAFEKVHKELPETIARLCSEEKVDRFVHISALGADKASSRYAKSKLAGEEAVLSAFPKAVILRPSVIFGEDDAFFNKFAKLAQILPFLPLIGGGKTRFQPVYVGDVADAALSVLKRADATGQIYELGGADVLDFRGIYHKLFHYTGRSRALISIPFGLAKIQGALLSVLPKPPLTVDQVESLKSDNVVSGDYAGLEELGIAPTSMDLILPTYLNVYRKGGRFADLQEV